MNRVTITNLRISLSRTYHMTIALVQANEWQRIDNTCHDSKIIIKITTGKYSELVTAVTNTFCVFTIYQDMMFVTLKRRDPLSS